VKYDNPVIIREVIDEYHRSPTRTRGKVVKKEVVRAAGRVLNRHWPHENLLITRWPVKIAELSIRDMKVKITPTMKRDAVRHDLHLRAAHPDF
jgi:hypothetical protein